MGKNSIKSVIISQIKTIWEDGWATVDFEEMLHDQSDDLSSDYVNNLIDNALAAAIDSIKNSR